MLACTPHVQLNTEHILKYNEQRTSAVFAAYTYLEEDAHRRLLGVGAFPLSEVQVTSLDHLVRRWDDMYREGRRWNTGVKGVSKGE